MIPLLLAAQAIVGGHTYAARVDAGGAAVAVWRYAASGTKHGPPVVLFGELGFDHTPLDALARNLQARGREVFALDWRGTGKSSDPVRGAGGLDAVLGLDAGRALDVALDATSAPCADLIGFGLGGAAAYLHAKRACAVVAIAVPRTYEVPNEALRRLARAIRLRLGGAPVPSAPLALRGWLAMPSPLDVRERRDLFSLLFGATAHDDHWREATGRIAPELAADVLRWMEQGDAALSQAIAALDKPLLAIALPRDNVVHPEHALARWPREGGPRSDVLVVSRIEGFSDDAGHLALQQAWAARELFPKIAEWLDEADK